MQVHAIASLERGIALPHSRRISGISLAAQWQAAGPVLLSLLRIMAGFVFVLAGSMKLFGIPGPVPATVPLLSQMGIGGMIEVVGGALLLIGLRTRSVAFILAGQMAVAYLQFHAPTSVWPVLNNGVAALSLCFVSLHLSAAGAGPLSVDHFRTRKRQGNQTGR